MRTKRTAPVTTGERRAVWLMRQSAAPGPELCEHCRRPSKMLTPREAAAFSDSDLQTLDSLLKLGKLHGMVTAEGALLVCLNSLL